MSKEIQRWADSQQYSREPIPKETRGKISVSLINATPDPLGGLVALMGIYDGKIIRGLDDHRINDEARRHALDDITKTALSGPMESIQFHFLIEGVTRSITHQMVRSRFSFFAQESLRFAVPEGNWHEEIPLPPFLAGAREERAKHFEGIGGAGDGYLIPSPSNRVMMLDEWEDAMITLQQKYQRLIDLGAPAEEARGVLPHDMPTRIHWVMDLRTLLLEAGKRTCTQAQFPWRIIFGEIAKALREYKNGCDCDMGDRCPHRFDDWQFRLIADKIRPVCYQVGKCTFMADFDRDCSIRGRVEENARIGRDSSEWGTAAHNVPGNPFGINPIQDWEWAADPAAARRV